MENTVLIHCYSRAEAIADGVLVDVTEIAKANYFLLPVAITCGVFHEVETKRPAGTEDRIKAMLDRLYDAIKSAVDHETDRVDFKFTNSDGVFDLYAILGPGDDGAPVITVMLIGED